MTSAIARNFGLSAAQPAARTRGSIVYIHAPIGGDRAELERALDLGIQLALRGLKTFAAADLRQVLKVEREASDVVKLSYQQLPGMFSSCSFGPRFFLSINDSKGRKLAWRRECVQEAANHIERADREDAEDRAAA